MTLSCFLAPKFDESESDESGEHSESAEADEDDEESDASGEPEDTTSEDTLVVKRSEIPRESEIGATRLGNATCEPGWRKHN